MDTNRLQHCMNVTYYGFLICRKFGWDYRSPQGAASCTTSFF
jgi:HD superfamily phosphodiesterase